MLPTMSTECWTLPLIFVMTKPAERQNAWLGTESLCLEEHQCHFQTEHFPHCSPFALLPPHLKYIRVSSFIITVFTAVSQSEVINIVLILWRFPTGIPNGLGRENPRRWRQLWEETNSLLRQMSLWIKTLEEKASLTQLRRCWFCRCASIRGIRYSEGWVSLLRKE